MFSIMSDLSNVNAQVANFKSANCTHVQFALLWLSLQKRLCWRIAKRANDSPVFPFSYTIDASRWIILP